MRRTRLILLGAVVLTGLGSTSAGAIAGRLPPQLPDVKRSRCPRALQPPLGALDRIRVALPALIRRDFGTQVNGNGTSYRDWQVEAAMSLARTYPTNAVPGAAGQYAAVVARCGVRVADNSWLLVLLFPEMHVINATWRVFVALTPNGWKMWAYD